MTIIKPNPHPIWVINKQRKSHYFYTTNTQLHLLPIIKTKCFKRMKENWLPANNLFSFIPKISIKRISMININNKAQTNCKDIKSLMSSNSRNFVSRMIKRRICTKLFVPIILLSILTKRCRSKIKESNSLLKSLKLKYNKSKLQEN